MPSFDDRLREGLERLVRPGDPEGALARVRGKKSCRHIYRRMQVGALVVAVVAGTAAGSYGLAAVFRRGPSPAAPRPSGVIVFVKDVLGPPGFPENYELFSVHPTTGETRQLTNFAGPDVDPAFSPDGTKVAFTRRANTGNGDHGGIFVADADGSNVHQLTGCPRLSCVSTDQAPVWSPDGRRIAFVRGGSIYSVPAEGGRREPLCYGCVGPSVNAHLSWSPDGRRIAFDAQPLEGFGAPRFSPLFVLDLQTGKVAQLTHKGCPPQCPRSVARGVAIDRDPSWSPDGTRIAFTRAQGAPPTHAIFEIDPSGSNAGPLVGCRVNPPAVDCGMASPTWSPDGRRLAYVGSWTTKKPGSGDPVTDTGVYLIDASGNGIGQVPGTSGAEPLDLAWQPGGHAAEPSTAFSPTPNRSPGKSPPLPAHPGLIGEGRIAFVSDRDGNDEIYTMLADGSDVRRLTHHPAADWQPTWSPDGTQVAFVSNRADPPGQQFDVYVMNADGTDVLRVTHNLFLNPYSQISWHPGGAVIAFSARGPGRGACTGIDCTNGVEADIYFKALPCIGPCPQAAAVPLTTGSWSDWDPSWSPDGSRLVFVRSETPDGSHRLFVVGLNELTPTSDPTAITQEGVLPTSPAWSPDGKRIVFSFEGVIYNIAAEGEVVRHPAYAPAQDFNDSDPAWSPDGQRLVFVRTGNPQAEEETDSEIYITNLDGTGQVRLTNDPANDREPSWQ